MDELQEFLLQGIDTVVKERMKKLKFNYYLDGIVKVVNEDETYLVAINGEDYTLKAREGLSLSIHDIVMVCVVNNDFSRKFIDLKRVV